jgi:hypothetical protein
MSPPSFAELRRFQQAVDQTGYRAV